MGIGKKAIVSILSKKFNDWVQHIDDEEVRKLVEQNSIITGGCIASMLLGEEVKDFDIYFTDKKTTLAVARYYVKKFNIAKGEVKNRIGYTTKAFVLDGEISIEQNEDAKEIGENWDWGSHMLRITPDRVKIIVRSDGVASENDSDLEEPFEDVYDVIERGDNIEDKYLEKDDDLESEVKGKYRPVFLSSNAITLSNRIQLVIRFYGDAEEIHSNYDFAHCTNYWESGNKKLTLRPQALESLLSKNLVYSGSKYPLCSIIRMRKFIKRGWHINAGQILKMIMQVNELDLKDIAVLEDQLVGVDSAYFMQLIEALESKQKSDESFEINTNYVCSIIDRIFG